MMSFRSHGNRIIHLKGTVQTKQMLLSVGQTKRYSSHIPDRGHLWRCTHHDQHHRCEKQLQENEQQPLNLGK